MRKVGSIMSKGNVAIVGFGYIGSVIGSVLANQGYLVYGVESNNRIIMSVNNKKSPFNEPGLEELIAKNVGLKRLFVSNNASVIKDCETVIITVGTPLTEDYTADTTHLEAAILSIKPYLQKNTLVMIKSTVPPHTTNKLVAPLLEDIEGVKIAFCPERLAEGKAIQEFMTIPIVVGGINSKSTKLAGDFWREALNTEIIEVNDATTAEMVKLSDNLWIDLNIALAGELAKIADQLEIDVLEVISAANTLPKGIKGQNVNILMPSVGVGGYCLTKDPWFVQQLGSSYGIELNLPKYGRLVNESMPIYSAELIDSLLKEKFEDTKNIKIAILGIAFKNNTGDCRFTPTKRVIDALQKLDYKLEICDPWTDEQDEKMVTDLPVSKDIEATIKNADCIAFLAGHDEFQELLLERVAHLVNENALIFDGRMFFKKEEIEKMNQLGLRYKGVGR